MPQEHRHNQGEILFLTLDFFMTVHLPNVKPVRFSFNDFKHPHDLTFLSLSDTVVTAFLTPQSQIQSQTISFLLLFLIRLMTVSFVNFCPTRLSLCIKGHKIKIPQQRPTIGKRLKLLRESKPKEKFSCLTIVG